MAAKQKNPLLATFAKAAGSVPKSTRGKNAKRTMLPHDKALLKMSRDNVETVSSWSKDVRSCEMG